MFRKFSLQHRADSRDQVPPDDHLAEGRRKSIASTYAEPARPELKQRSPTESSNLSSFSIVPSKSLYKSKRKLNPTDPLGLTLIHEPASPELDIIFIHGLGGTSRQTWSKNRDPNLFWPHKWLPFEPQINQARIFSFGYNANFLSSTESTLNISDFAKSLLLSMKFVTNNENEKLEIGKIPIIFVVHSMGGLVVKKAYLLGQNDDAYKDIVQSISAVLFLATPHRGTNLAEVLNKILSACAMVTSPKLYVDELNRNSKTLEDLNEQFKNIAPKLHLVSFYETQKTSIGIRKMMVLDKDSAILGYPQEISGPLDADHHEVCKYSSQSDPNYITVRSVLRTLVDRCQETYLGLVRRRSASESRQLESLLAVTEAPNSDLEFFLSSWMPGSCEWIFRKPSFATWLHEPRLASRVLWLTGPPGTGKSVLAASIISFLRKTGSHCHFYFFRFSDHAKRSLNSCLRSLAFQIAQDLPAFRSFLIGLFDDGLRFEKTEASVIWRRLFLGGLFKLQHSQTIYWVIDALDESDSSESFLSLFSSLSSSKVPINLLICSRKTTELSKSVDRLSTSVEMDALTSKDTDGDIRAYVERGVKYLGESSNARQEIAKRVLEKADGSFLWVKLVLDEISHYGHTVEDIEDALSEFPTGMSGLYQRMEEMISRNSRTIKLTMEILTWATCSERRLTLDELSQGLRPEFKDFVDLKATIYQVCGQFVTVDNSSRVNMVHQTAKDYLLQTTGLACSIDPTEAHEKIFRKCMSFLCEPSLRGEVNHAAFASSQLNPTFIEYAAMSWPYHLNLCSAKSDAVLLLLTKFLRGPYILIWIHILAVFGRLQNMVSTSRALTAFLEKRSRASLDQQTSVHCPEEIVKLWAADLIQLVGKFGTKLKSDPTSIYKLIPPFCPKQSIIYRQFVREQTSSLVLSISGISSPMWDDCLARLHVGRGYSAYHVMATTHHIIVLTAQGTIILWDASTYEEIRKLCHGERVSAMSTSKSCNMLVSSGLRTIKVWIVSTGRILHTIPAPGAQAMAVAFARNDSQILFGANDATLKWISLDNPQEGWQNLQSMMIEEDADGKYHNSPRYMTFNHDSTLLAVSYRGWPISVWDLEAGGLIGQCERMNDKLKATSEAWVTAERIVWNAVSGHLLGLYNDGCVVKWHPFDNEIEEIQIGAREIQCSPDGTLFATSDHCGTVQLWDFNCMKRIYQFTHDDFVRDLAFSSDCRRLYDIRSSHCNIWEPTVLIELANDDYNTRVLSQPLEARVETLVPVTALTYDRDGKFFWVGRADGSFSAFDMATGTEIQKLSGSIAAMAVDHLRRSNDSRMVAIADLSGKVTIHQTSRPPPSSPEKKWTIQHWIDIKAKCAIQQILFSDDSKFLLVVTQEHLNVWCLETRVKVGFASPGISSSAQKWINHPLDLEKLIGFDVSRIQLYRWKDLTLLADIGYEGSKTTGGTETNTRRPSEPTSSAEIFNFVYKVMSIWDGTVILLEFLHISGPFRTRQKSVIFVAVSDIREGSSRVEQLNFNFSDVLPSVEIILGIYRNAVIFLDKDHWICTWHEKKAIRPFKRHFFLPGDWLNMEMLELSLFTRNGTFLCPRNGEIAVVAAGLVIGKF